jgi:hypothetical protein
VLFAASLPVLLTNGKTPFGVVLLLVLLSLILRRAVYCASPAGGCASRTDRISRKISQNFSETSFRAVD